LRTKTSDRQRASLLSSTFAIAISSGMYFLPSVFRMKSASQFLSHFDIAVIGQMSTLQGFAVSIGTAGLVTSARVALVQRKDMPETQGVQSWLLYAPSVFF